MRITHEPRAHAVTFVITVLVLGGIIAFMFIIGRAYLARRFGHHEATSAIVVSYYWHFVDVVWIALFFIVYFLDIVAPL